LTRKALTENFNLLKEVMKYNDSTNELTAAGNDWIVLSGNMLRDSMMGMTLLLGVGANIALYAVGKLVGNRFVVNLLEKGLSPEEVPTIITLLLNQGGCGKAEVQIDLKNKRGLIIIENCVVAREIKTKEPHCHYLSGYFTGITEKLFGTETECVEIACTAKGDRACEFHIQQKQA
jgi:predicted hydrocarbon binding protein